MVGVEYSSLQVYSRPKSLGLVRRLVAVLALFYIHYYHYYYYYN